MTLSVAKEAKAFIMAHSDGGGVLLSICCVPRQCGTQLSANCSSREVTVVS